MDKLKQYADAIKSIYDNALEAMDTSPQAIIGVGAMCSIFDYVLENEQLEKDHIKDELMGADEYYAMFLQTGEPKFKEFAKDELRHSEYFIMQAITNAQTPKEKSYAQDMRNWHNVILAKLI